LPIVLYSAHAKMEDVVSIMEKGAQKFFPKETALATMEKHIAEILTNKYQQMKPESENDSQTPATGDCHYLDMIGDDPKMKKIFGIIERVAKTESTILVTGASGTGKELVARAIHTRSKRGKGPLVPVNCAAIPDTLLESELFGYEKGAFSGAVKSKPGRFKMADKGTIFLDEIGDMPPYLQVKLLRVLQDKSYIPLGGIQEMSANFRVVSATNKDLEKEIAEGNFREDLYFRLNVIPISIPPLRERRGDIPLLINSFLNKINNNEDLSVEGVEKEVMEKLFRYDWPGNVRELENMVERMMIFRGEGNILLEDVPQKILGNQSGKDETPSMEVGEDGIDFNQVISEMEKDLILQALEQTGWNKNKAASLLNLNRTTLVEKIKKKKLKPSSEDN